MCKESQTGHNTSVPLMSWSMQNVEKQLLIRHVLTVQWLIHVIGTTRHAIYMFTFQLYKVVSPYVASLWVTSLLGLSGQFSLQPLTV